MGSLSGVRDGPIMWGFGVDFYPVAARARACGPPPCPRAGCRLCWGLPAPGWDRVIQITTTRGAACRGGFEDERSHVGGVQCPALYDRVRCGRPVAGRIRDRRLRPLLILRRYVEP